MSDRLYPGPLMNASASAVHLTADVVRVPDYGAAARIAMAVNAAWRNAWEAEERRAAKPPEQPVVSVGVGGAAAPQHAHNRRHGDKQVTLGDLLARDDAEVARAAEHVAKLMGMPKLARLGDHEKADRSETFGITDRDPWEPGVYEVEWDHGYGWQFAEFVGVSDDCPYGWRASLDACGGGLTPDGALQATRADYRPARWRGVSGIQHHHWKALEMIAHHFPFPPLPVAGEQRAVAPV